MTLASLTPLLATKQSPHEAVPCSSSVDSSRPPKSCRHRLPQRPALLLPAAALAVRRRHIHCILKASPLAWPCIWP